MGKGHLGVRATGLLLLAGLLAGCGDEGSGPEGTPASSSTGTGGQAQGTGGSGGNSASASGGGGSGGSAPGSPCGAAGAGDPSIVWCMDFDASSEPADGWPITDQGFSPDGTTDVVASLDAAQWTSPPQSLRLTVSPGEATYISFYRQTDAALDEVDWVELSLDFRVDAPLQASIAGLTQQTERTTALQLGGDSLSVGVYDPYSGEGDQIALPTPVAIQTWMHAAIRVEADGTVSARIDDAAPVAQSFEPATAILKVGTYVGFGTSLVDQSGSIQFDNVIVRAGNAGEGQ